MVQQYADWGVKPQCKKISTWSSGCSAVLISLSSLHVATLPHSWSHLAYCLTVVRDL